MKRNKKQIRNSVVSMLMLVALTLSLFSGCIGIGVESVYAETAVPTESWSEQLAAAVIVTDYTVDESGNVTVKTALGLAWVADSVNSGESYSGKTITLAGDIDLSDYLWVPIGDFEDGKWFAGTFDGAGFEISGLYINNSGDRGQGLFGYTYSAVIKNVSIISGSIVNDASYNGGIVGYASYSTITDCNNGASLNTSASYNGGIAGQASACTITNCYNTGNISSSATYNGGIVASVSSGITVTNCYNEGNINVETAYSGGIIAFSDSNSITVTNSYNKGTIYSTKAYCAGIVGHTTSATVTNCYNTAAITGYSDTAGIVGYASNATVTNCYNTAAITGTSGSIGGIQGNVSSSTIKNCYNTGDVTTASSSVITYGGIGGYKTTSAIIQNCYTNTEYIYNSSIEATGNIKNNAQFDDDGKLTYQDGATDSYTYLIEALNAYDSSDSSSALWVEVENATYASGGEPIILKAVNLSFEDGYGGYIVVLGDGEKTYTTSNGDSYSSETFGKVDSSIDNYEYIKAVLGEWFEITDSYEGSALSGFAYLSQDAGISSAVNVDGDLTLYLGEYSLYMSDESTSVIVVAEDSELTLLGAGVIAYGYSENGGGVYLSSGATFNMYGGSIIDNKANLGGGVYIASGATFNLYDGWVEYNTATVDGGGVYVASGAVFNVYDGGMWTNTAGSNGGGVYVEGAMNIYDGSVSSNTATVNGGGVYVASGGSFAIADTPYVGGNDLSDYTTSNVYLPSGEVIDIIGDVSSSASIGVTMEDTTSAVTSDFASFSMEGEFSLDVQQSGTMYYCAVVDNKVVLKEVTAIYVSATGTSDAEGTMSAPTTLSAAKTLVNAAGVGEIILLSDIETTSQTIFGSGSKNTSIILNLNGYTITNTSGASFVIKINSSTTLDLYGEGTITSTGETGGITISSGGTLNMYGGTISGNNVGDSTGGGVKNMGTMNMYGGTISGNTATEGGGVYVSKSGVFNMEDGTISGNTAAVDKDSAGAGVYVAGTFNMAGGEISGNETVAQIAECYYDNDEKKSVWWSEGAVKVAYGDYTSDASWDELVYENDVLVGIRFSDDNSYIDLSEYQDVVVYEMTDFYDVYQEINGGYGGGVYSGSDSYVYIDGGVISNNIAGQYGGGLYLTGYSEISDSTISGNYAGDGGGGVYLKYYLEIDDVEISGNTALGEGGGVYVNDSDAYFYIYGGEISGNTAGDGGGGVYVDKGGYLEMQDGTISGNTADNSEGDNNSESKGESTEANDGNGGGVYISEGRFMMYGGAIIDNQAVSGVDGDDQNGNGGGVYVNYDDAYFKMLDGEISGNTAEYKGGGVYVYDQFTLEGGTISENTAVYGGGVYVNTSSYDSDVDVDGFFKMKGGEISSNTATVNGAGVMLTTGATMKAILDSVVAENTLSDGTANNVFVSAGCDFLVEKLEDGASIGVSLSEISSFGSTPADNSGYMFYDDIDYGVSYDETNSCFTLYEKKYILSGMVSLLADTSIYNGGDATPAITVEGVEEENYTVVWTDENGDVVSTLINAGTYTATITGTGEYYGTVVKTFEITSARLIFSVYSYSDDDTGESGYSVDASGADADIPVPTENYTITYIDSDGNETSTEPTAVGTYNVWVAVTGSYVHASTGNGDAIQVGAFTIYAEDAETPTAYTLEYGGDNITPQDNNGEGWSYSEGDMFLLYEPSDVADGYTFIGWEYDGETYSAFDYFTMPAENVVLMAVCQETFTVSGTILSADETALSGATVSIISGSDVVATATTNEDGEYSLSNVPAGAYYISVTYVSDDYKTYTSQTACTVDSSKVVDITLADISFSYYVEITDGSSEVVVSGLETALSDEESEDKSREVEFTITVAELAETSNIQDTEHEIGLVFEISIEKLITSGSGVTVEDVNETDGLITFEISLPTDLQGYNTYVLYRAHDYGDGIVLDEITTTANEAGEYIEVGSDSITAHLMYFSEYAVGYANVEEDEADSSTSTSTSTSSSSSSSSKYAISSAYTVGGGVTEETGTDVGETETSTDVEGETSTPEVEDSGSGVETPSATTAPSVDTDPATNGGYAVWIILAIIALGVVGFVIYKKKSNK